MACDKEGGMRPNTPDSATAESRFMGRASMSPFQKRRKRWMAWAKSDLRCCNAKVAFSMRTKACS